MNKMEYETVAKRTRQQRARNSEMLSEKVKESRKEAERKWKKKREKKVGSELVVSGYHHSSNGGDDADDDDEVVWMDETEFKKKVGLIEYEEKLLIENVGFHENMELVPVNDAGDTNCGYIDAHLEGEKEGNLCEDVVGVDEKGKSILAIDDGTTDDRGEDQCAKENGKGVLAIDDGANAILSGDVCADENEKVLIAMNDGENNDDSDSSVQILGERYNPLAYEGNEDDDGDVYGTPLAVRVVNVELGGGKTQNSVLRKEKKGDEESIEKNDALEAQEGPDSDSDVLPTSSSEEDDDISDEDFRIGKPSSSEDTMSSDYANDKDGEEQEGEEVKDRPTVEVRKKSKEKKMKRKKISKEQRKSDGLILSTPGSEFVRKRTRSSFKVNATWNLNSGGSSRQTTVIDAEEVSSTDREYTDEEEQKEIPVVHGLVPDAVLGKRRREKPYEIKIRGKERKSEHEMRGERKMESEMEKNRRLAMRSDKKKKKCDMEKNGEMEKRTLLESPLKKQRVKGLNPELQQVLMSTMTDPNGESPGLNEFMSSTNDSHLPLKFTFGVGKVEPPEKTEEELELDSLWKDLDFALDAFNIGSHDHDWDAKEDTFSTNSGHCQQMLCAAGRHHLVVDEEVGIVCSYCSCVSIEIKDVTPDFCFLIHV